MWIIVFYDIEVKTNKDKKAYTKFRNSLLFNGFMQMQYSVYSYFCGSMQEVEKIKGNIKAMIPEAGEVRILTITDKQYSRIEIMLNPKKGKKEENREVGLFF